MKKHSYHVKGAPGEDLRHLSTAQLIGRATREPVLSSTFYSPCECGNYVPRQSGQEVTYSGPRREKTYVAGSGQTVCENCGCHPPRETNDEL